MENKNRILWIDVAKGICMISVIAGHLGVTEINKIVFSYHLTVFFILSGYTLKNNLTAETLSKKFKKLMLPYFVTCIAVTLMDVFNCIVLKDTTDFMSITELIAYDLRRSFFASGSIKTFGDIEIGGRIGAIWYLPATFFAILVAQLLLKYVADRKARYAMVIPLALISCISGQFIWLPFSLQSAFLATPLILLGFDLKSSGILQKLTPRNVFPCAIVFLSGILINKSPVYYVTASMPDYVLSMVCALAASICVLYLSQLLEGCKILGWIGQNSLYYLCIHLFELETMNTWFCMFLQDVGMPVNALSLFGIKMLFITAVTMLILQGKKLRASRNNRAPVSWEKRDPSVDVAKAILIALMIVGHFPVDRQFRTIVYSFHMVAFVFFSGFCFRPEACKNLGNSIWKNVRRFLMPYVLFGLGYILLTHDGNMVEIKRLIYGISFSKNLFTDVSSIGPVYFILLLLITKVLYLCIERYVQDEKYKALSVLGISLLGAYLGKAGYWLPWSADCAMFSLIFYYLGYCFKKYNIMEYICRRNYLYFFFSSVWVYMIYHGGMEIAVRDYGNYGLTIFGAVSSTVLVYMVCRYLCHAWNTNLIRLICLIGQNTVYILIVHTLFGKYLGRIASITFTNGSIFYAVAMVFLQLMFGVAVGTLITHLKKMRNRVFA